MQGNNGVDRPRLVSVESARANKSVPESSLVERRGQDRDRVVDPRGAVDACCGRCCVDEILVEAGLEEGEEQCCREMTVGVGAGAGG